MPVAANTELRRARSFSVGAPVQRGNPAEGVGRLCRRALGLISKTNREFDHRCLLHKRQRPPPGTPPPPLPDSPHRWAQPLSLLPASQGQHQGFAWAGLFPGHSGPGSTSWLTRSGQSPVCGLVRLRSLHPSWLLVGATVRLQSPLPPPPSLGHLLLHSQEGHCLKGPQRRDWARPANPRPAFHSNINGRNRTCTGHLTL